MSTIQKTKPTRKPAFRIGDRVAFSLARGRMHGIISEDRGLIGVGGRWRHQIEPDFSEEMKVLELGEYELVPKPTTAV